MRGSERKRVKMLVIAILVVSIGSYAFPVSRTQVAASNSAARPTATPPDGLLTEEAAADLISELSETLGSFINNEDAVSEITERWDNHQDLAGKTKAQTLKILYEDVRAVVTDEKIRKQIWDAWNGVKPAPKVTPVKPEPQKNPVKETIPVGPANISRLEQVEDDSFNRDVANSDRPVLVFFWIEECGSCKAMIPMLENAAKEYDGKLKIVTMNVSENKEVVSIFKIQKVPAVALFKGGDLAAKTEGPLSSEQLAQFLHWQI